MNLFKSAFGPHLFFLAFYVAYFVHFQNYAPVAVLVVAAFFYVQLMCVPATSREISLACDDEIRARMDEFGEIAGDFSSPEGGEVYFEKLVKAGRYKEALPHLLDFAENEDPQAMYLLACLYVQGQAVPKNMSQAIMLLEHSADRGYPQAQTLLAVYYGDGKYVKANFNKVMELLTLAARQGEPRAIKLLNRLAKPQSDSRH
ncbi:MAG: sel1 repeat family protein [Zoogloeaceae bacterium]|jgi:TPR repeat protein|nr:sel1 repeat family protein [Zoogloeaceae bacterium]